MVAASFLSLVVLAASAVALPSSKERFLARRARRQGKPIDRVVENGIKQEQYSSNWAGAVYSSGAGTYKSVTATITVPKATGSSGSSASAWVGIDGDSCENAILQTGLDFNAGGTYDAWYEWYPAYAYDFSGISFSAGDSVTLTVTASSTKKGTAVIKNNTTGKSVTQSISSSSALCEQDAEWIVEDFEEGGGMVPFANFGTVTFTNAVATTSSGSTGPGSATIIDIQQNGKTLTQSSTTSSSVTVKYV